MRWGGREGHRGERRLRLFRSFFSNAFVPFPPFSIAEAQGRVRTTEEEFEASLARVRAAEDELNRLRTERAARFMEAFSVIEKAVQKTYAVSRRRCALDWRRASARRRPYLHLTAVQHD